MRSISGLTVGSLYNLRETVVIPSLDFDQNYYLEQAQERNHQILAGELALKAATGIAERKGAICHISLIAQRQDSDVGFDNLPVNRRDNTYIGVDVGFQYMPEDKSASIGEAQSRRNIAESELCCPTAS